MATTDARTGFRLPWSSEQRTQEHDHGGEPEPHDDDPGLSGRADGGPGRSTGPAAASPNGGRPGGRGAAGGAPRKPSKFLADLTRAMQVAAEAAREETLTRLQTDATTWTEEIHSRTADGASELRRRADDEVAAIREWSKAEMARIREETDRRVSERKHRLEIEIEEHATRIEQRIEAVRRRVGQFEAEMAAFFEGLLAEEDPGRFAALAENMPEPPPFDDLADDVTDLPGTRAAAGSDDVAMVVEPAADTTETTVHGGPDADLPDPQATSDASTASDEPSPHQAPDFAAAEAEALAGVDGAVDAELPELDDAELNARLATLVTTGSVAELAPPRRTDVVVTGLVSVASIAGFKRQLARLGGVQAVTVSSGPEGEFVFSVTHDDSAGLHDAIPELPGFGARLTGVSDGVVEVTARDPDPEP